MTTRKDLPEEATEEPIIRSPAEDAERATARVEAGESLTGEAALSLADPDNPLRIPGELSAKPREKAAEERAERAARMRRG